MDAYEYIVIDSSNIKQKGIMWGESETEVAMRLKRNGYRIYRIGLHKCSTSHSWKHAMVADVTYQLGLLIESGVPLRRALELLRNGKRSLLYTALYESVERGQSLSQALRSEGCPPIALALLESGEVAGTLGESLQYISSYYEWEQQVRQKVLSAISYPLFLLLLMIVFFLVAILFIIPSFAKVFSAMHITLPLITRALFALGEGLSAHPLLIVGTHISFISILAISYKNKHIQRSVHRKIWQLIHRYQWFTCAYYTSMLKVWSLLLESGISIIQTIRITKPLWRNIYGIECSDLVESRLLTGHSLCDSLQQGQIGNSFIWQMIAIGEESGELVTMLQHCSHYYESLLTKYIQRLDRLLEPILLTCMGVGVGILVISVMYPLFSSIAALSGQ